MSEFQKLFSPISIGGLTVRNRLMLTTHNPKMSEQRYLKYLEKRVQGGVGLVGIPVLSEAISTPYFVSTGWLDHVGVDDLDAGPDPETAEGEAFYDRLLLPKLRARAKIAHDAGAVVFGQVANRGAIRLPETFQVMVSPSGKQDPHVRTQPRELTTDEVGRVIRLFGRAAARVQRAGFDGVEIHATHGYLVEQFLSPSTNVRSDQYGGSLENRRRFLDEIIEAIQRCCGEEFPIGLRISGRQARQDGLSTGDIVAIVQAVQQHLAYVNVTAGTIGALENGVGLPYVASSYLEPGFNAEQAKQIKAVATVPIILTGRMNAPELMEGALTEGMADMIGITRALIADPEFLHKAQRGEAHSIRKCIGVNECHFSDRVSACPVNPWAGREDELAVPTTSTSKHVVIIGGGPAGMMCARTAVQRGHRVTLLERSDQLGGKVRRLARDPSRKEMLSLIERLEQEIRDAGVDVRLGVDATPSLVSSLDADAVVAATGALPAVPDLPGLVETRTMTALDILDADLEDIGDSVLVVGGLNDHVAPMAAAEFLVDAGKTVTLVSECFVIGQGVEPSILHLLTERLLQKGVTMMANTELVAPKDRLELLNTFSRHSEQISVDAVVFAAAQETVHFPELEGEFYRIGDALAPRRIVHATLDGARTALRL
ncbi:FAD-dependent oxidoreductase (plasmid) [Arthrobacter sp. zg-Y820]|uniref:FAD-dependent oxidoreductase n=1 Tax=unclassified Arthrobacter TaxID=235627 RepID=UPI001E3B4854|nr:MULTISPECIES: FAD-dependent oxidoreductase [unclassified Arthrobacter]MCC9198506.1 FAD-dependent oxidoreductase [Arthrobacter sp. zg-Y820]MDK1281376.1 FAD-dependent oxidoreductase [Arthrobacter sp. zg.Y820]WIB11232.1 FAD-dependent oxidoreductase [Arthrobacter sp. zg-Y820]